MAVEPKIKVMLAEDDQSMQSVLCTLLEIEGFDVLSPPVRASQEELINFIRSERPDVVLLDYHLGDISGLDVLRGVREDPAISNTRVIMTSGMDMQSRCQAAGADGFILKPFMPDELIQKLRG